MTKTRVPAYADACSRSSEVPVPPAFFQRCWGSVPWAHQLVNAPALFRGRLSGGSSPDLGGTGEGTTCTKVRARKPYLRPARMQSFRASILADDLPDTNREKDAWDRGVFRIDYGGNLRSRHRAHERG